jgi:hypothetical protein
MLHHMLRAAAQRAFNVLDPYFQYVTMLLHGDGTNGAQNNTFLDSSTNNFTITRNGNTTQGTFTPYGANWSNYFNGSSYITLSSAPISATGAFTFECWVFVTGNASSQAIYGQYLGVDGGRFNMFWNDVANKFSLSIASTSYDSASTYMANAWYHIAWVRDGSNNLSLYVNGVRDFTTTGVSTSLSTSNPIIAARAAGATPYTGYISNMRITNTAVYSGTSITVPTTPLTNISGTTLLTCQSNRFVDNETTPLTFTISGSPSVQRFSPFSPTTAYSTSVIGGSGYFDGSGDYLSTPSTGQFSPSGDFTISCWYYPTTTNTYQQVIGNFNGSASTVWIIEVTSGTGIAFYTNGTSVRISGSSKLNLNAWNYLVLARSGSTITGYVNGVSVGTYSQSGTFGSSTQAISIGRGGSSTASGDVSVGYIADVKLIDGSAVTTVPTAPQTATSGTQLLLNYTNAGILDNAMMNDLETVGNAQISTSVKKYGTGSIAFDGSGDYLTVPSSPNLAFGSGDFTVEAWVYLTANIANAAGGYLADFRNNSTLNFALGFIGSGGVTKMYDYVNDNGATSTVGSSTVTLNTWHHVAWVRSGTTVTLYFNGTANGTMTTSYSQGPTGVTIGARYTGITEYITGYIDDLRITKGVARYTTTFTPPTAAFPNN